MTSAPFPGPRARLGLWGVTVGGAALYLLAPATAPALLGAGLYIAGAIFAPLLALQLVVFSTPFYLFEKGAPGLPFSPTEFLLLGAVGGWALRRAWAWSRGERPVLQPGKIDWPLLLFLAGALAATFAAENLALHARGLRLLVVEPIMFYFLVREQARDSTGFAGLTGALLLAGAAVGLYALYQYAFTTETIFAEGISRARGLYGSPNNLGLFLGRVLPLCVCLALWGGPRHLLPLAALAPVALALILTFSIGAWLGVAAALLFVAAWSGHRRLVLALVGGGALLLATSWALGIERVTSHFSPEGSTWRWRGYVWQAGLGMVRDHPLLGIGLDNFLALYERYRSPEAWPEPNLSHPHNLVLDFWLSAGAAGLAGGLLLVLRLWARGVALWRRYGPTALGASGLGLAAGAIDTVVHGAFDNSYFLVDLALLFWLGYGLLAAQQVPAGSVIIDARFAQRNTGKEGDRDPKRPRAQLP